MLTIGDRAHANEDNRIAYDNALNLDLKQQLIGQGGKSHMVSLTGAGGVPDLSGLKDRLKGNVRIYIVGHGTPGSSSIGGLGVDDVETIKLRNRAMH